MKKAPTKVLAIHDISGYGRCALSVVLPVLSVLGAQVCPMPTSVLSTQTGGFENIAIQDMTHYMKDASRHYKELALSFEYIYTGYLGSAEQIAICKELFDALPQARIVVDPVMGDEGMVYSTITPALQEGMKRLVTRAELVLPNLTEACILLGKDYATLAVTTSSIQQMLRDLAVLGPAKVVITGVPLENGLLSNCIYDAVEGTFHRIDVKHIPVAYPGTGDIFSSVVIGMLNKGLPLPKAVACAAEFLSYVIEFSFEQKTEPRAGVLFEACMDWFFLPENYEKYMLS